jgi:acylphosphatase
VPEPVSVCVAYVHGRVQGVGFRWWVRDQLSRLGLTGSARNLDDGSVEIVARGDAVAIEALLAAVRGPHAPGQVESVDVTRSGHRA